MTNDEVGPAGNEHHGELQELETSRLVLQGSPGEAVAGSSIFSGHCKPGDIWNTLQGLCCPTAPQPAPHQAGHAALLAPGEPTATCSCSTHTRTHVLHEQSIWQCFSGSDFIRSETLVQDLVVFIYSSRCFLVLDNIFAAAKADDSLCLAVFLLRAFFQWSPL